MVRRRLPSLSALRAFEAFARTASMSRAGEELGVTHGAVSRQVKALEAELGAALVAGPRHRLELTPAGRDLAAATAGALDLIAAALPGAAPADELVLDCLGTFAMKWLIPRLPGFHAAHPDIRVRLIASHAPVQFGHGRPHAAIRIVGASPPPEGLRSTPFLDHHQGLLVAPTLLAAGSDLASLLTLPRLHSATFPAAWSQWAQVSGVDLPPACADREFDRFAFMLEACMAGLGVAIAPWAFAAADVEAGRLAAPLGFEPLPERYVVLRPRLARNAATDAMEAWLQAEGRRASRPPKPLAAS